MNLFIREMKRNFISFIIWMISLIIYIAFAMSLYPSIAKNNANYSQLMKQLPASMTKAFKLQSLDFSNIFSFFNLEIGQWISLCLFIYAMIIATGMLAKELDERTLEFLQAKPITRSSIITQKLSCYTVYIILMNLILFFVTFISFEFVKTKDYSVKTLALVYIGAFLIEYTFANLGLLISLFLKKKKASTNISLGLVLGLYLVYTLSGISDKLEFIKYFTPNNYANSADIIANGYLDGKYIAVLIIVNIAAVILSYVVYNSKDIAA